MLRNSELIVPLEHYGSHYNGITEPYGPSLWAASNVPPARVESNNRVVGWELLSGTGRTNLGT